MKTPMRTLALFALTLAPAVARAAEQPLVISAEPRRLEPVPGATVTLRVRSPEPPVITSSVGEVRPPREVGKGLFEAAYLPPAQPHPQIAIVVARAGGSYGWLPLPILGTGEITVSADRSGGATVDVAGRRFGPRPAGADGKATIRVVVPPGVQFATSGGRRLNLNLPNVPHVCVTTGEVEVPSNVSGTVAVRIFAVTADGRPRRGAPLELSPDVGTVAPVLEVAPGVYETSWSLPPSSTASIEARLAGDPLGHRAAVRRPSPEPRRIRMELERTTAHAGDAPLDFTVVLEDGRGAPVDGSGLHASISAGTFLGWTRGSPGRWTGHVAVPERPTAPTLVISASTGALVARGEVRLLSGPATRVVVAERQLGAAAPGKLSVLTLDRFGNRTDTDPPTASARIGAVSGPERQAVGSYQFEYRPPRHGSVGQDEILVRAGRAQEVVPVTLRRAAPGGRLSLGAAGGLALRSGQVGPVVGVQAALWPGEGSFGLALRGDWFRFSRSANVELGAESRRFHSEATYVVLGLGPTWRGTLGSRGILSLSLGGGLAQARSRSSLAGQPSLEEARWVPAATAAALLGLRALGGHPFVEARAGWVGDPHLAGLDGSFAPISFVAGYRFDAL